MSINKNKLFKKMFAVSAGVGAFLIGATMTLYEYGSIINNALQIPTSMIVQDDSGEEVDTAYYKSDYADANLLAANVDQLSAEQRAAVEAGLKKLNEDEDAFIEYEMENSAVLLKNNGALPLSSSERSVSLFGFASKQPLYSCASGGGKNDAARVTNYLDAFKQKGFTVNETLYNKYPDPDLVSSFGGMIENRLDDEPDPSTIFTADADAAIRETGGVGIVILSREGGEGEDIRPVAHDAEDSPPAAAQLVRELLHAYVAEDQLGHGKVHVRGAGEDLQAQPRRLDGEGAGQLDVLLAHGAGAGPRLDQPALLRELERLVRRAVAHAELPREPAHGDARAHGQPLYIFNYHVAFGAQVNTSGLSLRLCSEYNATITVVAQLCQQMIRICQVMLKKSRAARKPGQKSAAQFLRAAPGPAPSRGAPICFAPPQARRFSLSRPSRPARAQNP